MSDRDELHGTIRRVIMMVCDPAEAASRVLAEIERDHVLVPRGPVVSVDLTAEPQRTRVVWQASLNVPDGEVWAIGHNGEVLGKITGIQVE